MQVRIIGRHMHGGIVGRTHEHKKNRIIGKILA